ncbi:cytochrome c [Aliiroseovarius sp.]|uniref:c-type cytochrome n=1 Tax=Aliiroseovarius sp. TaxID=1872442 RepID=UPI0026162B66|nr:cytochrome c [Aliiroseovarius sp.]
MTRKQTSAASLAAVAVAVLLSSVPANAEPPKQPENSDVAAGEALYAEACASCHGANLEGQADWRSINEDGVLPAPPHNEAGHTWHHGDGLLFDYTKQGGQTALEARGVSGFTSGMPGFGDSLTDQEIWDILAFIKSNWPERIREMQATRTEAEQMQGGS